jgi:hypothetical protein
LIYYTRGILHKRGAYLALPHIIATRKERMLKRKIKITGTDIHVNNGLLNSAIEKEHVFRFESNQPTLRVFEGKQLLRTFNIVALTENPNLTGQFLHCSIRILDNDAVMVDGIISENSEQHSDWKSADYEAIRFQPFFLNSSEHKNSKLIGKGLFARGLHFSGTVTPTGVRTICVCDHCTNSFTLQHIHAGFSESQYFYSTDGKQTLVIGSSQIPNMPTQLQDSLDERSLEEIERQLPNPTIGNGTYKYFNSFKCPHCGEPFIDFNNNQNDRTNEYYGYRLINQEFQTMK